MLISEFGRAVSKHCVGMEGNVSGRIKGSIFIKASGAQLATATNNHYVEMTEFGTTKNSTTQRPSMEYAFHRYLLSLPNVDFVAHTHPTKTVSVLCTSTEFIDRFAERRLFPDQVIFNGHVSCVVPYEMPGDKLCLAIEQKVTAFMTEYGYMPQLILLRNHGIITVGKTAEQCIIATDICEKAAEIFLNTIATNKVTCLSDASMSSLITNEHEKYRLGLV